MSLYKHIYNDCPMLSLFIEGRIQRGAYRSWMPLEAMIEAAGEYMEDNGGPLLPITSGLISQVDVIERWLRSK